MNPRLDGGYWSSAGNEINADNAKEAAFARNVLPVIAMETRRSLPRSALEYLVSTWSGAISHGAGSAQDQDDLRTKTRQNYLGGERRLMEMKTQRAISLEPSSRGQQPSPYSLSALVLAKRWNGVVMRPRAVGSEIQDLAEERRNNSLVYMTI